MSGDHTNCHHYYLLLLLLEGKSTIRLNGMKTESRKSPAWWLWIWSLSESNRHLLMTASLNPTSEAKAPALASAHPHPPLSKAQARLPTLQFLQVLTWRQYWALNFNLPRSAHPPQFSSLQTNRTRRLITQSNSRDKRHAASCHLNVALAENYNRISADTEQKWDERGDLWMPLQTHLHPWMEQPDGPRSMELQWVGHDWALTHFNFLWVIKNCKQCKWLRTK